MQLIHTVVACIIRHLRLLIEYCAQISHIFVFSSTRLPKTLRVLKVFISLFPGFTESSLSLLFILMYQLR